MSAIRTILFARLLFPAPRVRWEAARSVATLIRAGDATVASDLLAWIAARPLESEAVLGLNLIEAFKLGAHFTPSALAEAVGAPSVLSATLFARLYPGVELDASKQWAFAPDGPAPISALQKRWFDRYRTWAVAPLFTMILSDLQRATGAPFLERWRHEWEWLQSQHERPAPEYPQFFSGYDRERKGQFDQSQRDIYLSAYLRTLAFAVSRWGLPSRIAEDRAGSALVFNRDLADIEPIARPAWAMDVYPDDDGDIAVGVRGLLAKMDLEAEQEPVAVRVIDLQDDRFIDIDVRLALIPTESEGPRPNPEELRDLVAHGRGGLDGPVAQDARREPFALDEPLELIQDLTPHDMGRLHIDVASNIRVASPYLFGRPVTVQTGGTTVDLIDDRGLFSRWTHWYVDWEPVHPIALVNPLGALTTVRSSDLRSLAAEPGIDIAWFARVKIGRRTEVYRDYEVEERGFWLDDPAPEAIAKAGT